MLYRKCIYTNLMPIYKINCLNITIIEYIFIYLFKIYII